VIKDPPYLPLEELVKPPNGLKHRILRETPGSDLIDSMKATIEDMITTGTCAFSDYREGGLDGASALKEALHDTKIDGKIFGRPLDKNMSYLDICDGTGLSSTSDLNADFLRYVVEETRNKGKSFAIHAGEKDNSDIISAIDLEPDHLVHLIHAEKKDIKSISDARIPVAVCVRSNFITQSGMPPIKKMLDEGILVAAGTDNVMLNSVNMFSEMEFLSKTNIYNDRQVFMLCTLNGAKLLGIDSEVGSIKKGKKARLMILTKKSNNLKGIRNPLNSIVRRGRPDDIIQII
jgi:cytosine/adenosine deaminase-related metal-dependent hydrolase